MVVREVNDSVFSVITVLKKRYVVTLVMIHFGQKKTGRTEKSVDFCVFKAEARDYLREKIVQVELFNMNLSSNFMLLFPNSFCAVN